MSFVPTTKQQHDDLAKKYSKDGPFTQNQYQQLLQNYLKQNKEEMVFAVCLNNNVHSHGFLVAFFDKTEDIKNLDMKAVIESCKDVYEVDLESNTNDFDLPKGLTSVFRGYQWPFVNCVQDIHFDMLKKTFTKKGLVRHCTTHYGNFEMIGTRRLYQSNGSLIVDPDYVIDHQYYRDSMNLNLLPYVKSIVNSLQEEAIHSNYNSGESLMSLYKHILNIRNEKELCKQTILTQNHFHSSIHKDKGSVLTKDDKNTVLQSDHLNHPENSHKKHMYIQL